DRSASPTTSREGGVDPDAPPPAPPPPPAASLPPPPPPNEGQALKSPAAVGWGVAEARQVASARIPQRVRSLGFTSDGDCLVTCGDRHVKFWTLSGGVKGFTAIGGDAPGVIGGATITDELKGDTFVDVSSGKGGPDGGADSVFCVTSGGVLCAFTRGGVMEQWVSLEAPAAYGVSVHPGGTLAAACADGLVRLFRAADLRYIATLPRPPPLGRANIASLREAGVGGGVGGRYPAALGCRLSPTGTKVVVVYADRGLFVWDVADPQRIGKYRSFLAHGACIWDVQRMPARAPTPTCGDENTAPPPPDIPPGAMVTCSADNTVRIWDLGALDGKVSGDSEGHSGRYASIP
ncbi:unnamed protein product, partial [Laminaria digitata]